MMSPPSSALPFWVPARFLFTGLAALCAALTALALDPELLLGWRGTSAMLAVVHTATLLFVTMTFAGAVQQLAPVLLETPLRSLALARWSYPLLAAGGVGVVLGFAFGYRVAWLAAGGVLALSGLGLVVCNVALTAARSTRRGVADGILVTSVVYLLLTLVMGTLLALARVIPTLSGVADALPLHVGLGLFGAFFLGIAGAGHKLLAMFVLSHGVSAARLRALGGLVHAAMALLLVGALFDLPLHAVAAILLALAVLLFLADTFAHLRARRRRFLEPAVRHYVVACAFLVVALLAAAIGNWTAAVASILAGFLPTLVAGMSLKILAFLAWQHRYARHVGSRTVPLLRDMSLAPLEPLVLWGLAVGGAGVVAAYLVAPDGTLLRVPLAAGAIAAWACLGQGLWIAFADHGPSPSAGTRSTDRLSKEPA